ncbi:avidin-like protein [Pitangus sulphuratus]|nr:avidin-like protein [Pitangus sulphuratus]
MEPVGTVRDGAGSMARAADSITVFTGQCFLDKDGEEVLKTMWLLRSRVDDIKDDWKATRVGTNVFTRKQKQLAGGGRVTALEFPGQ